jgi:hypothetical protein
VVCLWPTNCAVNTTDACKPADAICSWRKILLKTALVEVGGKARVAVLLEEA